MLKSLYKIFESVIKTIGLEKFSYRVAQKYFFSQRNENNSDMATNGELDLVQRNISNLHTLFDVGANVGEWTESVLSYASQRGHDPVVYAFEPSRYTFEKLKSKLNASRVHSENMGLGSKSGEKTLYVLEDGGGGSSLYQRSGIAGWPVVKQREKIMLDTVDHYCASHNIDRIDFMKIDTEGNEFEVLKGASNMLRKGKINVVQFEYGGCWIDAGVFLKDAFSFFRNFNYQFYKVFPTKLELIKGYDQQLDNFQYANYALVRKGFPLS